jgi:hypothetical protein
MLKQLYVISMMLITQVAFAGDVLGYLTDVNGEYAGPSVADQVALMDKDHNGFADVFEVRAYLELKHGKDYEKDLLDRWAITATAKSCGTSFAKELYSDKTN